MKLIASERSIADTVIEAQRRRHWAIFGLHRDRSDAFEPWPSDDPFYHFVLERLGDIWAELETTPPQLLLPALVIVAGSDQPDLDSSTLHNSLHGILDKLLHSDADRHYGKIAHGILVGRFLRDAESLDKALAEVATLQAPTPIAIRESIPLSADALKEAFSQHQSELLKLQADIATKIENMLAPYAGMQPVSVAEGQDVCRTINDLVAAFGLRLKTAQMDDPATLAYYRHGGTKTGAFMFTGVKEGKRQLTYGATVLPALKVVAALPHGLRRPKPGKKKR